MKVWIPDDLFELLQEYDRYSKDGESNKDSVEGLTAAVLLDFINSQVGKYRGGAKLAELYDKYISEHGK